MSRRITLSWVAGILALGTFVVFRIAIPWLVNMQDTGAILGALLLAGLTLTADFVIGKEIVSLWSEQEENTDEE